MDIEMTYTPFGERETLVTHGQAGAATTTWKYNVAGLLDWKQDAANKKVTYTYKNDGRLETRAWARSNAVTTYQYQSGSAWLAGWTYSDGVTPAVSLGLDRAGRRIGLTDAAGTAFITPAVTGATTEFHYTDGLFQGFKVETPLTTLGQLDRVRIKNGGTTLIDQDYSWDAAIGRLSAVTQGSANFTPGYHATSGLPDANVSKWSGTTRLTAAYTHTPEGYLDAITNTGIAGIGVISGHDYLYNGNGWRTRANLADGSAWHYTPNSRGEITGGRKKLDAATFVPGHQFVYVFDGIGNRTSASRGGDAAGANLATDTYVPNLLNQYATETVSGQFTVTGESVPDSDVRVNNEPATWQGGMFYREVTAANGSGPVAPAVEVEQISPLETVVTSRSGYTLVPPQNRVFTFDDDGNLLSDGLWTYAWDGENRLSAMESHTALPASVRRRLEFRYDGYSRRFEKKVYAWDSVAQAYVLAETRRFVYQGWNLIAELDGANVLQRSYAWANDLSGTLQGAGGVGGLVAITLHAGAFAGTYFPAYDGNGNVMALVSASDGSLAARYEYGPFGEALRATGSAASANPFRFSTKYTDDETGLLYYGYRFYNPQLGRWANRDPIEEAGE
jgi:RHS repeat-associated protein